LGWPKAISKGKSIRARGVNDYSTWAFTYTSAYHAIENKTNQLIAQISCLDDRDGNSNSNPSITTANLTKSYSVNVIGTIDSSESATSLSSAAEEEQNNGTAAATTTTMPLESTPSVPTTPSIPLSPSIEKQEEDEDAGLEEEEPQPEPEPEPEEDEDTTIFGISKMI
jgi:hypothetical protein